ncbi:hypothetical protein [Streptomyces sp. ODS28]|uniref:hypothetical protein n=1 Tax=Streptomyces sp. ODS28 TaxID=3136688 RepID=UPI0031E8FF53
MPQARTTTRRTRRTRDTHTRRARGRAARHRRALRREAPSTVALLAREPDFALMRAYRSFAFRDHRRYLRRMEQLLRHLTEDGIHTRVALFDPVEYGLYCRREGLDPDTPASRARYVAEIAASRDTVAYAGQPMPRLARRLAETHARDRARHLADAVLDRVAPCPDCGTDLAHAAMARAARALAELFSAAGPGGHHLVCSIAVPGTPLLAAAEARAGSDGVPLRISEDAALALTAVLAAGLATGSPGGLVLRTRAEDGTETVRGWTLDPGPCWLHPLTAAQVFAAYCTDPGTGDPVPPEPGVEHLPGYQLPHPGEDLHCDGRPGGPLP